MQYGEKRWERKKGGKEGGAGRILGQKGTELLTLYYSEIAMSAVSFKILYIIPNDILQQYSL